MMLSRMRSLELVTSVSRLRLENNMAFYNGCRCIHTLLGGGPISPVEKSSKPLATVTPFSKHTRFISDDKKVTALTVIKDLKYLKCSPTPALVLGLSGVIPFLAPPVYMAMTGSFLATLAYSQVAYGAVILSFVGAVRWGLALSDDITVRPNWINLGYSVTPSLVAWVALMMPTTLSLSTLILGLGGAGYMDITMYGYPAWFKAMRFLLTMTAILSLWTTLVFKYVLSDSAKQARVKAKKVTDVKQEEEEAEKLAVKESVADLVLTEVKGVEQESKPALLETEEVKQKLAE